MGRFFITRKWRWSKAMLAFFVIEFPFTVAMLTLAGIASPDTYRTALWQNGYDNGFNSNPMLNLYQAANYEPISTPVVWSGFLTQFNVIIAVLSMFILLVKSTMFVMHAFIPLLSVLVHIVLVALYAVSVRNQSSPDMKDPERPSPGMPWMMSKGCGYATEGNRGYCQQAVAQFAVTIAMLALFTAYLVPSLYACVPTPAERAARDSDMELRKIVYAQPERETDEERAQRWEQNRQMFMNMPKTPATPGAWTGHPQLNPMTPRTVAFTALNGVPPSAKTAQFSQRELPFREHYGREEGDDGRPEGR